MKPVMLMIVGLIVFSCSQAITKVQTGQIRPNIILIITDDQRWDALGCAGNPVIKTPNMDLLAQKGTRFTNAFVTTPICAASRASIFSGLYERKHGYTFEKPPLKAEYASMAYPAVLRQAGYQTGFIGKFGIKVAEEEINMWFDYFQETHQPYFNEATGAGRHLTDVNFDLAIQFIRKANSAKPFCLSISTHAPHADDDEIEQYFWPAACDSLYTDTTIPAPVLSEPGFFDALPQFVKQSLNRTRWYWRFDNPEKYQRMVKGYYRMISGIDLALGRLLKVLKEEGIFNNTVIILMGDNGYFLGERGFAGKWTMHDISIRVPLIVSDARDIKKNHTVDELVLNTDLAPTILELAGIDRPILYQGKSLIPLINSSGRDWRREILTEHLWDRSDIPRTEAVRTKDWKYIRYPDHPEFEELYNLRDDPREAVNLAMDETYRARLEEMRKTCDKKITEVIK